MPGCRKGFPGIHLFKSQDSPQRAVLSLTLRLRPVQGEVIAQHLLLKSECVWG